MKNCFLIVNFNDYKSTKHLVDNIIDYKIIDEIVIVDNSDDDQEIKLLKKIKNKKITLIENGENLGYSEAINIGGRYLIEKYHKCNIIVSNSDIVIMSEEDLEKLLEYLNFPDVGVVAPQILERGEISRGMKSPSPIKDFFLNIPLLRHVFLEKWLFYKDDYYSDEISVVDVINGCFFLLTSEVLEKINYMDANLFLYYESDIMGRKIKDLGMMTIVVNSVKVKHKYSVSVDKSIDPITKYKMHRDSQNYFHTTYNHASSFSRFLLKISTDIGLLGLRIIKYFKR